MFRFIERKPDIYGSHAAWVLAVVVYSQMFRLIERSPDFYDRHASWVMAVEMYSARMPTFCSFFIGLSDACDYSVLRINGS